MAWLLLTRIEQVNAVWTTAPPAPRPGPAHPREIPRQKKGPALLSCLAPLPNPTLTSAGQTHTRTLLPIHI